MKHLMDLRRGRGRGRGTDKETGSRSSRRRVLMGEKEEGWGWETTTLHFGHGKNNNGRNSAAFGWFKQKQNWSETWKPNTTDLSLYSVPATLCSLVSLTFLSRDPCCYYIPHFYAALRKKNWNAYISWGIHSMNIWLLLREQKDLRFFRRPVDLYAFYQIFINPCFIDFSLDIYISPVMWKSHFCVIRFGRSLHKSSLLSRSNWIPPPSESLAILCKVRSMHLWMNGSFSLFSRDNGAQIPTRLDASSNQPSTSWDIAQIWYAF